MDEPRHLRTERSPEDAAVELATYLDECVADKNLTRAVRRLTSTGVAPADLGTSSLIAARCPTEGADFTAESATTFENDLSKLGSADIPDAKELERVAKKWTAALKSAPRRSAPGRRRPAQRAPHARTRRRRLAPPRTRGDG